MTPIEQAARALVGSYPLDSGETPLDWQDVVPVVRAVLTALREPSEAMVRAADVDGAMEASYPDSDGSFATGGERLVWQAMIDAALEEG